MRILYYLSGRVMKKLDRGDTVQVALPLPAVEVTDYLAWAISALPDVEPIHVRAAEYQLIRVQPRAVDIDRVGTLDDIIGAVQPPTGYSIGVECIVTEVKDPKRKKREHKKPPIFPAYVVVDGYRYPFPEAE